MKTLECNWGRMAYEDAGQSPVALLLLHGSGCDLADWDLVLPHLHPAQRVVRMDFRAHGHSDAPPAAFTLGHLAGDALQLLDHLNLAQVLVVGHSLGGMAAMTMAEKSGRIAGLVLLEGWTGLKYSAGAFAEGHHYGQLPAAAIGPIQRKDQATRRRADVQPGTWKHFRQSIEQFDGRAYLARAAIPIIEVYGGWGRTEQTQARLGVPPNPNLEWIWVDGAGHYLPLERPDAVAQAIRRALDRINRRPQGTPQR